MRRTCSASARATGDDRGRVFGKPVGIDWQIGKRPLIAGGNVLSGGDIAMMEYSRGRKGPSLQILINHDDAEREYAYAEKDGVSLNAARAHDFKVVSIRDDWRKVFATPGEPAREGTVSLAMHGTSSGCVPA